MSDKKPNVELGTLQDFLTSEIKELPSPTNATPVRFKNIGLRSGLLTKQEVRSRDAVELTQASKNARAVSQLSKTKPKGLTALETQEMQKFWSNTLTPTNAFNNEAPEAAHPRCNTVIGAPRTTKTATNKKRKMTLTGNEPAPLL